MIPKFEWKPSYSVGIKSIDQQHMELFRIVNKLAEAISGKNAKGAAANTMHEMSMYIGQHFNFEEPLLEKHPQFDQHQLEHLQFIETTLDFQDRFAHRDQKLHIDMLNFLINWLKTHILDMDKKYFEYLEKNKQPAD